MRPPIYEPKGAAREYGGLALNIYTGCPHRCYYCFAPGVLHTEREKFHSHVEPRPGIIEETRKQLERGDYAGKTVHLCFTCDPYPTGYDSSATREIIKLLKIHDCHVQILTKGDGSRDFDLLDDGDWYGITISSLYPIHEAAEPNAVSANKRLLTAYTAKRRGIKTWVSFEPVLNTEDVLQTIQMDRRAFDRVKIGKLNYYPSDIDWAAFGREAEALCQSIGLDYTIKESLRKEMERA